MRKIFELKTLVVILALPLTILAASTQSGSPEKVKTVALGNNYQAVMTGDLTCGSTEAENERLVFAQNSGGEKREYKIISLTKTTDADPPALNEVQRLLGNGYQIKDLFYSGGLNVVFER